MPRSEPGQKNGMSTTKQFLAVAGGSFALVATLIAIYTFLSMPLIVKAVTEEIRLQLDRHEMGIHPSARQEFVMRKEWEILREQISKLATSAELDAIRMQLDLNRSQSDIINSRLNTLNARLDRFDDGRNPPKNP